MYPLVRRKILRLYFCKQRISSMKISIIPNGVSPVASQNLASPEQPIPIHSFNNLLAITAYTPS